VIDNYIRKELFHPLPMSINPKLKELFQSYFHPLAFAIFPLFSLYVNNIEKLRLGDVLIVALIMVMATVMILPILNRLVNDDYKSTLLLSIFWILFFSFEHVIKVFSNVLNSMDNLDRMLFLVRGKFSDLFWLLLWGGILFVVIISLMKYRKDLAAINQFFNVFGIGVLGVVFFNWIFVIVQEPHDTIGKFVETWQQTVSTEVLSEPGSGLNELPDIFYIILDGFGRADILQEYYQIETDDFTSALDEIGFYIAESSYANYHWTLYSIASSLNFIYLDELIDLVGPESYSLTPQEVMIENNRLMAQLKLHGYRNVIFASEYAPIDITSGDVYLSPNTWVLNAFLNEVINMTPFPALIRNLPLKSPYDFHREHVEFTLSNLSEPTSKEQPTFVFAHIIAPHPPFVFGPDGQPLSPDINYSILDGNRFLETASPEEYFAGYRGQTTYILERMLEVVTNILSSRSRPVVIIIQADHGPGVYWDTHSLENTDLRERMAIFNAYYFSAGDYDGLYPEISPVNSFRVVLNSFLDTKLPMLPDRHYFFPLHQPYSLIDVTDELVH
jgi:hypothetical protein